MSRIALDVPYSEKDQAKRLGARWDKFGKTWYIPDGISPRGFEKWLAPGSLTDGYEIVCDSYVVMRSRAPCLACGTVSEVCGFMLPPMHKTISTMRGPKGRRFPELIEEPDFPALLLFITRLEPSVAKRMGQICAHYQMVRSDADEAAYFANHCERCGQRQSDFCLFEESGSAFDPTDVEAAEKVRFRHIREPFACDGATSYYLQENLLWSKFYVEHL